MASTARISGALAALFFLLSSSPLAGCGDSSSASTGTTGGTGTTTGSTGTTETTTGTTEALTTSGTTAPTSSTGTTTTGPGTTTGTTGATTDVTTGTTTGTTGTTDTTDTTAGTTDTTGQTDTGSTTGEPVGATCEQDSDCKLYTDCCTCDVLANDEAPPPCAIQECFVEVCATLDIGQQAPVCRFGRCTFAKVTCNPSAVICDAAPPNCPVGQLPSVNGDCWSGQCTPVEACDWAPDCAACATDPFDPLVCVLKLQKGPFNVCEPKPVGCGDAPEIDCACGAEICDASPPHTECHDQVPGIQCECPFC